MPVSWRRTSTVAQTTARILKNKEADKADDEAKAAAAKAAKEAKAAEAKAKKDAAKAKSKCKDGDCNPGAKE
jgi:hypothetical protein